MNFLASHKDIRFQLSTVLAAAILTLTTPTSAAPTILTGTVTKVRDGDTIEVGKIPVRLKGVSAPEMNEPLGQASKTYMQKLVLHKTVYCELNGEKTYDRLVGICTLSNKDIGISVIEAGLAIDCPRYSNGMYAEYETVEARQTIRLPKYCQRRN
jgi:micrococcal nuclease